MTLHSALLEVSVYRNLDHNLTGHASVNGAAPPISSVGTSISGSVATTVVAGASASAGATGTGASTITSTI